MKKQIGILFNILLGLTLVVVLITAATIWCYVDPQWSAGVTSSEGPKEKSAIPVPLISNKVHAASGLKEGAGLQVVVANCTACHSARLITQNRATKEGWKSMIKWMQQTQGLWPLGKNEEIILDYLAKNYPPTKKGRRANLENVEWYVLEE